MESSVTQDDAQRFVRMFETSEMSSVTARTNSERSRDYYDHIQLTEAEVATLKKRKQPIVIDNVIAGKVNWLLGQEMNQRTDPKAYPREEKDTQGAEAITDAVRYVCDNQSFSEKRSSVWKNMVVEGFGGVEVTHRNTKRGPEILINYYQWDRLFYDPHSREPDFSDARYKGAVIWADEEDLLRAYPKAKEGVDATGSDGEDGTYGDTNNAALWYDGERKRIRIVMMHYLEDGVWHWVKFTRGYIIDSGKSPYINEDGESVCQLHMRSAYVNRHGDRYGEVFKLLDQQDEINKRRSKLLHMANSRQTMSIAGAVKSVANMKRELAKPDGHVEYEQMDDSGRPSFQVIPTQDMATSQFALLQEAKESVKGMGATEALMGNADGDSGRAVLAKQQGAMQGIAPMNDQLHQFTRDIYEAVWQRIRQLWTAEKWIRVTDDERNIRFVGLNQPVTLAMELRQYGREEVEGYLAQEQIYSAQDPRLAEVIRVENEISKLDVDIVMEETPDTVTLESETFEQLVNIDTARGGALPFEMLIEASPLRSKVKEKILKYFEDQNAAQQQGQQGQQGLQEQAMMVELEGKMVDIGKKQAETENIQAKTQNTNVETQRLAVGY
jgi:hypothetical protein